MNSSLNTLHHSPSSTATHKLHSPPFKPHLHRTTTTCRHLRRHLRRRHLDGTTYFPTTHTTSSPSSTSHNPDTKLHMVINLDQYIPNKTSLSLDNLLNSINFNQFIQSGNHAVEDLRTLVTVDADRRVVVSCRKSTVWFFGQLIGLSLVSVVTFKVLVKLGLGFRSLFRGSGGDGEVVVTRRDRSLGGKEVVVSAYKDSRSEGNVSVNPLSGGEDLMSGYSDSMVKKWEKAKKKLPDWWPEVRGAPLEGVVDKEESQRKANSLIRGWLFLKCEKHDNVVDTNI